MSSVLGRYLTRLLLVRTGIVLLGLVALMLLLEFLADGDQVIAASDGVVGPLLRYTLLRSPDIVAQVIPVAALLGGLLTLAALGRHGELTAIVAAGVSPYGLLRAALPVALGLAVLQLVIEDQAVPTTVRQLRAWGVGDYNPTGDGGRSVWLRDGDDIVRIDGASADGRTLFEITIFRRDDAGNLIEEIDAERATYDAGAWRLETVVDSPVVGAGTNRPQMLWTSALTPEVLASALAAPRENSFAELLTMTDRGGLGAQPTYRYAIRLHERFAGPATTAALVLLMVALARPPAGRASQALLLLGGLVLGFLCWTFDGLTLSFGELGLLPPAVAAWSPIALIALLALSLLTYAERHRRSRKRLPHPPRRPPRQRVTPPPDREGLASGRGGRLGACLRAAPSDRPAEAWNSARLSIRALAR